jgi:predicted GIY-YIG superfamily endonuclease
LSEHHEQFWVYILENEAGQFSIGQTENLIRRVAERNDIGPTQGKYTLKNGPWTLVWSGPQPDRAAAMRREREIKPLKTARWIRERLLDR